MLLDVNKLLVVGILDVVFLKSQNRVLVVLHGLYKDII